MSKRSKKSKGPFVYVEIPKEDLDALGIELDEKRGTTLLPDVNDRHVDLLLDKAKATQLVALTASKLGINQPPRLRIELLKQRACEIQATEDAPLPRESWLLS